MSTHPAILIAAANVRSKPTLIEKHMYLASLAVQNQALFYSVMLKYTDEFMPLVYTPVVGYVCQSFSTLFPFAKTNGRGLFISIEDMDRMEDILRAWPRPVKAIVVTDGERILGLGDQGVNGMGIPIGKLSLYSALAGVDPNHTLPVTLDVGTNNKAYREDPVYLGLRQERVRGEEYYAFVAKFMETADRVFDHPLIQHEDFGNKTAWKLLKDHQDKCCFNDDIQGTASVVLGGILGALKLTGQTLAEQKFLFYGAGEAGAGIAELLATAVAKYKSVSMEEARKACWLIDSQGLVTTKRGGRALAHHKIPFAKDHETLVELEDIVKALKPTALIGVAAVGPKFTEPIVRAMSSFNDRPIIFALSNPTDKAEVTAANAYEWSDGKAIYASGSPFDPVEYKGRTLVPGQGNNSYIFPGIGLACAFTHAKRVDDHMMTVAAEALASLVTQEDLDQSCVYPPLTKIRQVSLLIATQVSEYMYEQGFARNPRPSGSLSDAIAAFMYTPSLPDSRL